MRVLTCLLIVAASTTVAGAEPPPATPWVELTPGAGILGGGPGDVGALLVTGGMRGGLPIAPRAAAELTLDAARLWVLGPSDDNTIFDSSVYRLRALAGVRFGRRNALRLAAGIERVHVDATSRGYEGPTTHAEGSDIGPVFELAYTLTSAQEPARVGVELALTLTKHDDDTDIAGYRNNYKAWTLELRVPFGIDLR
jgi:hypothetical protein